MNQTFVMYYTESEPNSAFPAGFHMVGKSRQCTDHQPCCKNRGLKRKDMMCGSLLLQRYCTCHKGTP